MVTVIFYEKPGCINNTKQKALLQAAGHQIEPHNLLTEPWTADRLRPFFGDRPVVEWFNPSAPQVKSGEVQPEELDADTALTLMVSNPLLIRRPLLQVGDRRQVGFDLAQIEAWIGLETVAPTPPADSDLETCPRAQKGEPSCQTIAKTSTMT